MKTRSLLADLVIFLIALCGLLGGCLGILPGLFVGPHILIAAACQLVVGAIATYVVCRRLQSRATNGDHD
jgi:hypothetical protein